MNKRQKFQVGLAVLFLILFVVWLIIQVPAYSRILGLLSNDLGFLSMVVSYKAEEKNKKDRD